jgi:hypothetical protein
MKQDGAWNTTIPRPVARYVTAEHLSQAWRNKHKVYNTAMMRAGDSSNPIFPFICSLSIDVDISS